MVKLVWKNSNLYVITIPQRHGRMDIRHAVAIGEIASKLHPSPFIGTQPES